MILHSSLPLTLSVADTEPTLFKSVGQECACCFMIIPQVLLLYIQEIQNIIKTYATYLVTLIPYTCDTLCQHCNGRLRHENLLDEMRC